MEDAKAVLKTNDREAPADGLMDVVGMAGADQEVDNDGATGEQKLGRCWLISALPLPDVARCSSLHEHLPGRRTRPTASPRCAGLMISLSRGVSSERR